MTPHHGRRELHPLPGPITILEEARCRRSAAPALGNGEVGEGECQMPFNFTKDIFCVEGIIHALEEAKKDKENKDTGRLPCGETVLFPGLGFLSQQQRVVGSAPADQGPHQGAENRRVRFHRRVEIRNKVSHHLGPRILPEQHQSHPRRRQRTRTVRNKDPGSRCLGPGALRCKKHIGDDSAELNKLNARICDLERLLDEEGPPGQLDERP